MTDPDIRALTAADPNHAANANDILVADLRRQVADLTVKNYKLRDTLRRVWALVMEWINKFKQWRDCSGTRDTPGSAYSAGYRYLKPCDPHAIDPAQLTAANARIAELTEVIKGLNEHVTILENGQIELEGLVTKLDRELAAVGYSMNYAARAAVPEGLRAKDTP